MESEHDYQQHGWMLFDVARDLFDETRESVQFKPADFSQLFTDCGQRRKVRFEKVLHWHTLHVFRFLRRAFLRHLHHIYINPAIGFP